MQYKFVQWGKNFSLNGDRLQTMADNDDYLYSRARTLPQGIIHYSRKTSNQIISTSDPSEGTVSGVGGTFFIQGPRLLRFTLFGGPLFNAIFGDGYSEYAITLNGSYLQASAALGRADGSRDYSKAGGIGSHVVYAVVRHGSNTVSVTYAFPNLATASPSTTSFYVQVIGAGMTLIIEDMGEP